MSSSGTALGDFEEVLLNIKFLSSQNLENSKKLFILTVGADRNDNKSVIMTWLVIFAEKSLHPK